MRSYVVFVFSALAILATACVSDGGPPAGEEPELQSLTQATIPPPSCTEEYYDGHRYLFCAGAKDWWSARTYCQGQGLDLARIDSGSENSFVQKNLSGNSWIGGQDTTEGTWKWTVGDDTFYQGGVATSGYFVDWNPGEPNNQLDEDCLLIDKGAAWNDTLCIGGTNWVCESVGDACPDDPAKTQPGQCGCGVLEIDTDRDGIADCIDLCPLDATHARPGDCGCPSAPQQVGTACDDGLCSDNDSCDGAGHCGSVSECSPSANCNAHTFEGKTYFFCRDLVTYDVARANCQASSMDLVAIEGQAEDDFVALHGNVIADWIGAREIGTTGKWTWLATEQVLFNSGATPSGVYSSWFLGTPEYLFSGSCGTKNPSMGSDWDPIACNSLRGYVCEESGFRVDAGLGTPGTRPDPEDNVQDPWSIVKIGDDTIEFVANQLILETSDPTVLAAFNARYGGTVVETIDFPSEPEDDLQNVVGIRLDPNKMAYPGSLKVDLGTVEPEFAGMDVTFADLLGARLFATWVEARQLGFDVDVDLLNDGKPALSPCYNEPRIMSGRTEDRAPPGTGPGPLNMFSNPELSLTKVPEAWQSLILSGRYFKSVTMVSVDRGFVNSVQGHDYDGHPTCARNESCRRGNQVDSQAGWRWHGAQVSYVLMGEADNQRGAAGVAGRLVNVEQWEDPGRYRARMRAWRRVMRDEYDIMTTSIALGGDARKRLRLRYNRVIRRVARKGLLFAAAGNDGRTDYVDCNYENVQCVAGLTSDGSDIHEDSNRSNRVDFYAPFSFTMPLIAENGDPTNTIGTGGGTSLSTPHVAAIAAMAMAANPTWRERDGAADRKLRYRNTIVSTLKSCAQVNRAIDASCVVKKALEAANAPPAVCIIDPLTGGYYDYDEKLTAQAAVSDWGASQTAYWTIDGVPVGQGNYLNAYIPLVGTQELAVQYGSASDAVDVTRREPDDIKVVEPPSGACIREADARAGVKLLARDMAIGAPPPMFNWTGNAGLSLGTGNGSTRSLSNANAFSSYRIQAELDDGIGSSKQGAVTVEIVSNDIAKMTLTITGMTSGEDLDSVDRLVTADVDLVSGTAPDYEVVWLLQRTTGPGEVYLGSGNTWLLDASQLDDISLHGSWSLVARIVARLGGSSCALAWDQIDVTQPFIVE